MAASVARPHVHGHVSLHTQCLFRASVGFLPEENGIKLFTTNPARVIPAHGPIR